MERVPSKKEMRYDRQLRLWGDHGQLALEQAHVCLLNVTAAGCELLKSIVLPGVGRFTIVDHRPVTEDDVSTNFFITADSVGRPKAQVACQLLKEMNEDVKGEFIEKSVDEVLEQPEGIGQFSVLIGCDLPDPQATRLSELCAHTNIPLLLLRCVGLVGYARICVREHCVIETHPENPFHDLRLDTPFPALQAHADSIDLDSLSHVDHSHTPYLILLLKALERWRRTQGLGAAAFPSSYAEKKQIQAVLREMRQPDEKGDPHEENFEEAINSTNRALRRTEIPSNTAAVLQRAAGLQFDAGAEPAPFWVVAHALHTFVESANNGQLPLSGALPDMTADSHKYIQLQHIYQSLALHDAKAVHDGVQGLLSAAGQPFDLVPFEFTLLLCKHAHQLHAVDGRSLPDEYKEPNVDALKDLVDNNGFCWYVTLRARERFLAEKNRYPGTNGIPCPLDTDDLQSRIRALAAEEWQFDGELTEALLRRTHDFAAEMCRYGACELHGVASVLGGVCAHECIKLITHQYLPFDNTYVYDANTHNSYVLRL